MSKDHQFCIMRITKLHTNANVGGAISHHLRTRETDNADPEKMKKNWFYPNANFYEGDKYNFEKNADIELRKKAQQTAMARFKKRLPEKVRKNGVRAVEFMMTVSPEAMQKPGFNAVKYLNACQQWARDKFGKENVFFIAHHFDETTPHVSLLLTPIDENGKLNARKYFGGREKMSELQDDFFEKVGKQFGLERGIKGSRAKHQTIKSYYAKLNGKEKELDDLAKEIYSRIPDKKLLQDNAEYKAEIFRIVQDELEQLKPGLQKTIENDQARERVEQAQKGVNIDKEKLKKERADFENEKKQNSAKLTQGIQDGIQALKEPLTNQITNEVFETLSRQFEQTHELYKEFQEFYETDNYHYKRETADGERTVNFEQWTKKQLADALASFYLDDEPTVHKRKREIEQEYERKIQRTHTY